MRDFGKIPYTVGVNIGTYTGCCGGSTTPQDLFRLIGTDTGDATRETEFTPTDYKLQSAPHYNHRYKHTILRTIKPQNVM